MTEETLEAALDAIEELEEQLGKPPREMDMSAVSAILTDVDIESDELDAEVRSAFESARQKIEHVETAARDEHGVIGSHVLAELAPVAARAARERRETLPAPGAAAVAEGSKPIRDELDVDLEAAEDPLTELRAALRETDRPPWWLTTLVDVDEAVIDAFRPAFEQAYADPDADLYGLLYNYGATDLTVALDGYDIEYYFEHRNSKMKKRRRGRRREDDER